MRKLSISWLARAEGKGLPHLSNRVKVSRVEWATLAKRLQDFKRTSETAVEYSQSSPTIKADLKDQGFFVGGEFKGKRRLQENLLYRSMLTFDLDYVPADGIDDLIADFSLYEFVLYSTHSHTPERPRLRMVFPLSIDVSVDEYRALARYVADGTDIDYFDEVSFRPTQIMYYPSTCADVTPVTYHNQGEWLDPADWLPADWEDFMEWPRTCREGDLHAPGKQAEDPLGKTGIIGAFCRTYDIHAAIDKFLPDYFEPSAQDNRYSPVGAKGPAGAIVYDDVFLWSNHSEAIPQIYNRNLNAFDLVRVILFDEAQDDEGQSMMQRHSMKEMALLASSDPEVMANLTELEFDDDVAVDTDADPADPNEQERVAAKGPTADEFLAELKAIDEASLSVEAADAYMPRIAQYEPHQTDMLLKSLQRLYESDKPGIQPMRDSLKRLRKQLAGIDDNDEVADIERELVDEILDEHFASGAHLMRYGKRFWYYRSGKWVVYSGEAVRGKIQRTLIRLREERPEDVAQLVAAIGDNKTSTLVGSLNGLLIDRLADVAEDDPDPLRLLRRFPVPIINCLNCELHFDYNGNMTVADHNPAHRYTLQVATDYDADAQCSEWDRFVNMIFRDCMDPEDMVRHLEELGGYILSMSKWLKVWVLFHGPTDTGKSTVLTVLKELLGTSCLAMEMGRFSTDTSSFAYYSLLGKLLLADDDFDKSASLPDGFIKKISEEKRITTDVKFGDPLDFESRAMPLICANHWPVTKDVSTAFHERALVFEFMHRIAGPEKSDQRRDLMLLELPGILNRFVAGLIRLRARGSWSPPIDAMASHTQWSQQSNAASLFVADCLHHTGHGNAKRADVWRAYKHWAKEQGGFMLSKREFQQRMLELLGPVTSYQGDFGYTGWQLSLLDLDHDDGDIDGDE